ncbi:DNA-binding domain of Mlu1-box binding protein MBP1 [Xylaria nigripes]|nr:DNA-binding domain of Mlu1-box binding protein MBP1 [Xylaria nigripes]
MVVSRPLPSKTNPLMTMDVPVYADLVSRRRLGQTQLTPKMVAASTAGEVDPSALGVFDYAHLRAPLPKGITSGIFKSSPSSYFLMRRSQDGYVSATGMFKATFPYAAAAEEEAERRFIKSLPTTSPEETAGNVWIPPEQSIALAEEYGIKPWISALLDPAEIAVTNAPDSPPKKITAPPKFDFEGISQPTLTPLASSVLYRSTRSRRSASPAKKKAVASPRKRPSQHSISQITPPKTSPLQVEIAPDTNPAETVDAASPVHAEDATIQTAEKRSDVLLAPVEEEADLHVSVGQEVQFTAGGETKHKAVEVELPARSGPPSAEEIALDLKRAEEMVALAATESIDGPLIDESLNENKGKRKADEITANEDEEQSGELSEEHRSKKVKTEVQLRKERVRNRALVGLSATLAVGALIPYVMGVF